MTALDLNQGGTPYDTYVAVPPGTAAAPSVRVGSAASGLFAPSAGALAAAIGGAQVNFPSQASGNLMACFTAQSTNGLYYLTRLPLFTGKNSDGSSLAVSAAAGKFGISVTAGTSEYLLSEAANSNTKTDIVLLETMLPVTFIPGSNVTLSVNCNYNLGSGTVGTHTLTAAAYLLSDLGTMGSTIIATAAQTVPIGSGRHDVYDQRRHSYVSRPLAD
jgi:hypothetical protein